jgi:hypothetical protein
MNKFNILLLIIIGGCCFSCKKDERKTEAQKIVSEWTGKEILFPKEFQCNLSGNDTISNICTDLFDTEYKVLLYVDSIGCSDCRFKLQNWKHLIGESDSLFKGKLTFLFFFQPKNKKEINYLLRRDAFNYPLFIDMESVLNRLNHFPDKMEYQCFLLNRKNEVAAIGNPTLNPKVWELYKQTIIGKPSATKQLLTTVRIERMEIELNDLRQGQKSSAAFKLKNEGSHPLIITHVDTSCGCTVPKWDKKPIEPEEETEIEVEITPEETGFFHKTVKVYGNMENEMILLTVKGMVEL